MVEIIVADSGSNDRTVDIAASYPVTIVQLANPVERSRGIGPQLGFQHSRGRYVLILDADMLLHATFVRCAMARMKSDSRCGGIGGQLIEYGGSGYEYDLRRSVNGGQEGEVNWLDGGGLYRREAIMSVGYLSNRNLHAYEEKELGLRLRYAGWHLYRLSEVAVDHYGHSIAALELLWRRWRSGYADACGESIRACFGKPYLLDMVLVHRTLIGCLLFQLLFLASIVALPWFPAAFLMLSVFAVIGTLVQYIRKKGVYGATYSLLYTNVFAMGLAKGILKQHVNPGVLIQSIVLKRSVERPL